MSFGARLGGSENFLWTFLRHSARNRIEPHVLFLKSGPFRDEVAALGIPTSLEPVGRYRHVPRNLRAVGRLARRLRRERPDLVVNWTAEAQLYGGVAAALAGLGGRVVWWQHGVHGTHWLDPYIGWLPAAAIGASSHAAADEQARHRPRRPTFVVHPGIEEPPPDADLGARVRAELGIPAGRLVLGVVGRLHPEKGQDRLLEAVALLRSRGADEVHVLLVGDTAHEVLPGYADAVRGRVRELGLEGRVTFTGQVSDALGHIRAMDVLVNPCTRESFGIVLVEAMASGVPVVAVDAWGPAEVVEHGRSGVLAASSEPAALAAALEPVVADADLRRRLAEGGRARYAARFRQERMVRELEAELCSLAARS